MDTRIYIAAHKPFDAPKIEGYIPLHVGRKGKNDLGYIGDDTGDNISEKNPSFCELTGLYWIWKNISCDIVGLCHYRRYFFCEGSEDGYMHTSDAERILKRYDIITGKSLLQPGSCLLEQYDKKHVLSDVEVVRRIIEKKYSGYLKAFDECMSGRLLELGNMMISSKSIFDDYCKWLFDILFAAEEMIDLSGREAYQARAFGFLSERLMHVWIMMHPLSVYETAFLIPN
ncbi:MAG: DUF4422 domain-containing protein [Lachnospiraceae bacterium]|nr:DUF4422 domain-containing protein [Lachnospiraceae bacterium]